MDANEVDSLKAGERAEEGEDSPHFDIDWSAAYVDKVRERRAIERERKLLPGRSTVYVLFSLDLRVEEGKDRP